MLNFVASIYYLVLVIGNLGGREYTFTTHRFFSLLSLYNVTRFFVLFWFGFSVCFFLKETECELGEGQREGKQNPKLTTEPHRPQ